MHNFCAFFLWALAVCILWQGSFAEDQSGYICLIEEQKQNQCDSICLTELSLRLSEVVKAQNQGITITRNADNEIKSKLEALEVKMGEVQVKLPQEVYAKLEGRLQEVQTKLEGQQTKMEAKLDESLLAVQKKIEIQLQTVLNQLQVVSNKIDGAKMGAQASSTITIPSGFELIGNRYFRIVNEKVSWQTAERKCREMGAYLASFRNEEEFNAIQTKLETNTPYWLGFNDRDKEGYCMSVASQKPALFLKWRGGIPPSINNIGVNCVYLENGIMDNGFCYFKTYFICQADNKM